MHEPSGQATCGSHGGRTASGAPCSRPAGWGTNSGTGRCIQHLQRPSTGGSGSHDRPEPPGHLSEEGKALWRDVLETWHVGPDGLRLLRAACESWDLYLRASAELRAAGTTFTNPETGAIHRHPAAGVAKDALSGFRLSLKDIGLEPLNFERRRAGG